MLKKVTQQRWGPRNDLRGIKKLCSELGVICCPTVKSFAYFDAKDDFFFSFFESSQAMGLIPSPTERYFQNWTALFEEVLLSL